MKKIILLGFVFLLLISFAFASNGIPVWHDPCNSDLGWQDNSGMTLTFTGVSPINVTSCKFTGTDGKIMSYNTSAKYSNAPGVLETFNMSARFRLDTTNDYTSYLGVTSSSTSCHWRDGAMLVINPSSSTWLQTRSLGGDRDFIPKSLLETSGSGVTIMWEFNNTVSDSALEYNLYVNGVKNLTNVKLWKQSCNFTDLNGLGAVTISLGANNVFYVDDIRVFNHSTASSPPSPPPSIPNQHTVFPGIVSFLNTTPSNDTQWNYPSKNFSATVNSTLSFNCSLYLNNTINTSFPQTVNGTNIIFNTNLTFPTIETTISHFWSCTDNSSTVFNSSVSPAISFIDMIPPNSTVSGFINGTNGFMNNITAQFNFTDGFMLHSYNISIDGTQIGYKTAIGDKFADYNLSVNPNHYSVGLHTIQTRWADGHTSEELGGDYDVNTGLFDSYLEYGFYDEGEVTIDTSPSSIFDEFSTTKETDRYKFVYEPFDDSKSEYYFTVESDLYIDIYPDAVVYDDYLIIGNHWLDFRLTNEPYAEVTITRINDYEVSVNISNIQNPSLMEFNSIGDLNIVEKNYSFSSTNVTVSFTDLTQEHKEQYHTMRINKTEGMFGTNAFFYYNNSNYSFTKTSYTGFDLYNSTFITPELTGPDNIESRSFTWTAEVIGINNESYNLTNSQNIFQLGLDNCSTFNVTTLNFSLKDETTDSLINGTMSAFLKTWISDTDFFATFNLSWGEQLRNNFPVCLFPPHATYSTYAQMEYVAPGYSKKLYYFANASLTNITKNVDLFLNNQTSQIQFTVVDTDDNPIEDVFIKVLSYDIGTNSYKVSEILKTDTDGVAYGQLVKSTGADSHWYQFIIEYNFEVKLTTEPTKITEDTRHFRISLVESYFDQITAKNKISNSLTYTEATNNFNFIFSDPTGTVNEFCLRVEKNRINSVNLINQTCVDSSAGTILLNAGDNPDNSTITATSYMVMNPIFKLGTVSIGGSELYKTFGQTGIFVTFLLTITLIGVGIWSPAVATIMALIGVTMSIIMNIFYLQWGMALTFIILGVLTIYRLNRK